MINTTNEELATIVLRLETYEERVVVARAQLALKQAQVIKKMKDDGYTNRDIEAISQL